MGESVGVVPTTMVAALQIGMGKTRQRCESAGWRNVVIVALVLLVAQLLPSPLRRHPAFSRVGPDKLLHLLGHAAFSATLVTALDAEPVTDRRAAVIAVILSSGYGLVTGQLQKLVPGRVPERADFVASLTGAVLGAVGWQYLTGA